jgi:hypothetical protein
MVVHNTLNGRTDALLVNAERDQTIRVTNSTMTVARGIDPQGAVVGVYNTAWEHTASSSESSKPTRSGAAPNTVGSPITQVLRSPQAGEAGVLERLDGAPWGAMAIRCCVDQRELLAEFGSKRLR